MPWGFKHLELEVTSPRVAAFREGLLELFQAELGDRLTTLAYEGFRKMLNYVGGGLVFIRENFKDRLRILATSWAIANANGSEELEEEEDEKEEGEMQTSMAQSQASQAQQASRDGEAAVSDGAAKGNRLNINAQHVPSSFSDMFYFNAAVMGLDSRLWMFEVLKSFDALVRNVASSNRLQENWMH